MLFEIVPEYREVSLAACDDTRLTVGVLDVSQLEEARTRFGFSAGVIEQCLSERERYRNSVDVFDTYTFCVVTVVDAANPTVNEDKVAFFFKRNLFLMVTLADADGSAERIFMAAANRYWPEAATMEKVVAAVLEGFIERDGEALAKMAFDVNAMEKDVVEGKTDRHFNTEVFERRRQLLHLGTYYEQLIDIGEELLENENDIFPSDALHYIAMFAGRVTRLSANVQLLRDSLTQVREAYQAALDYSMNRVIRTLTVLATIYMPPTLIAGWYGMNFRHMPELDWHLGYPLVIGLSVLVVLASLWYFKRKKLM
jgi:magnesium transporter